jgi:hypothetical protein
MVHPSVACNRFLKDHTLDSRYLLLMAIAEPPQLLEPRIPGSRFLPRPRLALLHAIILGACSQITGPAHAATLEFSTYFGGEGYEDAFGVAVDAAGNIFITGGTVSPDTFPLLDAFQTEYGGGSADGFVAGFDPEGKLLFSTYFGAESYDYANAIAVDREGNIIIVGETHSTNLPTNNDAFQPFYAGGTAFGAGDGFIARFSPDGSRLLYCSYFGGSGDEKILSVAVDAEGNVVLTGQTDSLDLPLRNALQPQFGGGPTDGFIAKFDPTLRNLIFSTFFGGSDRDEDQRVAVDPEGHIHVCGQTLSMDFPVTAGAFQKTHGFRPDIGVNYDAFVAKLTPDGSALIYSTYIGGATYDAAFAIAADASGSAYVTGAISVQWADGSVPLGFQPEPGLGGLDAFVAKLKPDGSNFEWFSYLGGSGEEVGYGIALDLENNLFVAGSTDSHDFPLVEAVQPAFGGFSGDDAFAARISADGQHLLYSTYLGGSEFDQAISAAVDPAGNLIVGGYTHSTNFPVRAAWQETNRSNPSNNNSADAFVAKITPTLEPPRLEIVRSGNQILIAWPSHFGGYELESTELNKALPDWHPVAVTPLLIVDRFVVIETPSAAARIYRLRRPS